jgi:uncharacterized membrane protein (Fun14 family)
MLLFVPPLVQVAIGVILLVAGLAVLHLYVVAGVGIVSIAIGATRYVRSRRGNGARS